MPHGPHNYAVALATPVEHLPHTVFPPTPDIIAEELENNFGGYQNQDSAITASQVSFTAFFYPTMFTNKIDCLSTFFSPTYI